MTFGRREARPRRALSRLISKPAIIFLSCSLLHFGHYVVNMCNGTQSCVWWIRDKVRDWEKVILGPRASLSLFLRVRCQPAGLSFWHSLAPTSSHE